jgi:hypothetical protein
MAQNCSTRKSEEKRIGKRKWKKKRGKTKLTVGPGLTA